jgi:tetratricopeptide (TPR) repeat protein
MRAAGDRVDRNKLEIIVTRKFDSAQTNSMCAPCHAKMSPLDTGFQAGKRFFDHYNLVLLEDRDFYPDGRDLGENFTYTLWLISPCVASGKLDCVHCHTSSGRYKFTGADADKACLPCHARHVENPAAHSFHRPESTGSRCVGCHMPETTFARMRRHDHSMLPPAPAATLKFKSPNACNICHHDRDAQWADTWVRKWYPRDYQAPLVHRGNLIEAARREDWAKLDGMLAYVTSSERNEVFAASLLRLLDRCPDSRKWPAVLKALRDPSPLVRSSAAMSLAAYPEPQALAALLEAASDSYRVVRIQAAIALSRYPLDSLDSDARRRVDSAFAEYEASMRCQPDDPRSHYNLGNYYQERGDLITARREYEIALRLLPSFIPALVNLSIVHARLGEPTKTEWALREALRYNPTGAEANFNLGLHLAEQGRTDEAEKCLRTALNSDPTLAEAAYNLAVLVAGRQPAETIALCRKAAQLRPQEPKYAYTLAFYLRKGGDAAEAISTLRELVRRHPEHVDSIALLGSTYEETGRREQALQLYRSAVANEAIPPEARRQFAGMAAALQRR